MDWGISRGVFQPQPRCGAVILRSHLFSKTPTWAWTMRPKICPLLGLIHTTQGLCGDSFPSGTAAGGWVEDAEISQVTRVSLNLPSQSPPEGTLELQKTSLVLSMASVYSLKPSTDTPNPNNTGKIHLSRVNLIGLFA